MKARKSLAKRIIKAVQPTLEAAVRAETDISNKPVDSFLKELEELLDASLHSRRDSVSVSMGEAVSLGDIEGDVEMADASQGKDNDVEHRNGDDGAEQQSETYYKNAGKDEDAEMHDEDASHELEEDDIVAVVAAGDLEMAEDTIIAEPLTEVNGNISPSKGHTNGVKNTSTPPDTNGYVTAPETQQPAPPTPPISNGGHAPENADLNTGGLLWYLKEYQPEGTSIVDPHSSGMSEDLSDMDDEELKVLGGDVNEANGQVVGVGSASASKAKKGKAKKRAKPNRW
jgi:NuA3 HAT complex component NTO1